MLKQEGLPDTNVTKTVYPTSMSMSHTIGIPSDYFPVSHQAEEPSKATGKLVTHTYYHCSVCSYKSQNQDSTYTHTHHHLNTLIGCTWPGCKKSYEAPNRLMAHVKKYHGDHLLPEALTKDEAEAVVASLLMAS